MALYSTLQKFITKEGAPVEGASVNVKLSGGAVDAEIFATRTGTVKSNPFLTTANGEALCYVKAGRYDMTVTKGTEQIVFKDVEVGPVSNVGTFAEGGTITDSDQLVEDADGNLWAYTGALNHTYQAGIDPKTASGWKSVSITSNYLDNETSSKISAHNSDANAHPELYEFITSEADRAETAADVAQLSSGIYAGTTAGLDDTVVGEYFSVPSTQGDEYINLYEHLTGGTAGLIKTYPSSKIVEGVHKQQKSHFFIQTGTQNVRSLVMEESFVIGDNAAYIKFTQPVSLGFGSTTYSVKTWAQIKSDIGDLSLFVTSPNGVTDSLKLLDTALVYDLSLGKFDVVPRQSATDSDHLVIAHSAYGQITSGLITDWMHNQKIKNIDVNSGAQLYLTDYNEMPVVEQYDGTDSGLNLYVKFEGLRIRGAGAASTYARTWADVKAEIGDPSLFVTSNNGVLDTLKLINQALVFDYLDSYKLKVVPYNGYIPSRHILVCRTASGQLTDGLLYDWWNNQRINQLENKTGSSLSSNVIGGNKFIAHGGMNGFINGISNFAPFNSLPAYRLAGQYGYWGAEADLVETLDGEWVLIHDLVVDNYTFSTGNVADYTLAELKAMDNTRKSPEWSDVPVAELGEFLKVCAEYGMVPVMEFKSVPTDAGIHKVVGEILKHMPMSNAVLMTFDLPTLRRVRALYPEIRLSVLLSVLHDDFLNLAIELGNCYLSIYKDNVDRTLLEKANSLGIEVAMWQLDQSEVNSDLINGVKYLITDIAVPVGFNRGLPVEVFKNNDGFTNMTSKGVGTVSNKKLPIPGGDAYTEFDVEKGNVITVSVEAKQDGAPATNPPAVSIIGYDIGGTIIREYTTTLITSNTFDVVTASAVAHDSNVSKIRVNISCGSFGSTIRGLNINIFRV